MGFQKCYNYLKYSGLSYRIDKLHSLYGMARVLSLGYFLFSLITIANLFIHFVEMNSILNLFVLAVYIILMLTFYAMTKKYFYRWIEWVFIEYQCTKNEEANKK